MRTMNEWSDLQQRHLAWLAIPEARREPVEREAWARALGVTVAALEQWEQSADFRAALRRRVDELSQLYYGDVMGSLVEEATQVSKTGSTRAKQLFFEIVIEPESARLSESRQLWDVPLTEEELAIAAREIEEWRRERGFTLEN
ncbi:MAG: hypothetical protein ACRDIB_11805 [Ardenticatenaceae bacterium]